VDVEHLGRMGYEDAWALQRAYHADIVAGTRPDTVLLLEHDSVYTAGKRTALDERPLDPAVRVIDVDRGGKITWHGPGQLVGYPLVHLPQPLDVVSFVRRLEGMLIDLCAELGLPATRVEGRSGAWTEDGARKIAAIGLRVARGVTMHGFAINANPDLAAYDLVVACGIRDAGVTSLSRELGRDVTVDEISPLVEKRLDTVTAVAA
jgi:lipoyl(octanoyl) transferase